jgi:hypothetical protein
MHAPPFRLARHARLLPAELLSQRIGDASPEAPPEAPPGPQRARPAAPRRRARLAELDPHLHCSVIGTCLSVHELRNLVTKFSALDRQQASDLEIHHAAVELAIAGGAASKALHKALDERHAGAVRRFASLATEEALLAQWNEAVRQGDIPPAYWALMTHPQATLRVRQAAFGEVHMLSHLVGAANRADLRRLVALEEENAALREKVARQQARLQQLSAQHQAVSTGLTAQIVRLTGQAKRQDASSADTRTLQQQLADSEQRVAHEAGRREAAEQRLAQQQASADALRASRDDALALLHAVQAECQALESATLGAPDAQHGPRRVALDSVRGKCIVYVGGRPGTQAALKALVSAAGGELVVHDGGLEDRKGLLSGALARADFVAFPVDCIDHDSMGTIKRVCERHGVRYHPLRTASVASFVELIARLERAPASTPAVATQGRPPSAFCLRHG